MTIWGQWLKANIWLVYNYATFYTILLSCSLYLHLLIPSQVDALAGLQCQSYFTPKSMSQSIVLYLFNLPAAYISEGYLIGATANSIYSMVFLCTKAIWAINSNVQGLVTARINQGATCPQKRWRWEHDISIVHYIFAIDPAIIWCALFDNYDLNQKIKIKKKTNKNVLFVFRLSKRVSKMAWTF